MTEYAKKSIRYSWRAFLGVLICIVMVISFGPLKASASTDTSSQKGSSGLSGYATSDSSIRTASKQDATPGDNAASVTATQDGMTLKVSAAWNDESHASGNYTATETFAITGFGGSATLSTVVPGDWNIGSGTYDIDWVALQEDGTYAASTKGASGALARVTWTLTPSDAADDGSITKTLQLTLADPSTYSDGSYMPTSVDANSSISSGGTQATLVTGSSKLSSASGTLYATSPKLEFDAAPTAATTADETSSQGGETSSPAIQSDSASMTLSAQSNDIVLTPQSSTVKVYARDDSWTDPGYPIAGSFRFVCNAGAFPDGSTEKDLAAGPLAEYSEAGIYISPNVVVAATNGLSTATSLADLANTPTAVNPVRAGYQFTGWYNRGGLEITTTKIVGSAASPGTAVETFYPRWEAITSAAININAGKYVGSSTTATTAPAATSFTYTLKQVSTDTAAATLDGADLRTNTASKTINVASGTSLPASPSYSKVSTTAFSGVTFTSAGTYNFEVAETTPSNAKWSLNTAKSHQTNYLTVTVGSDFSISTVSWNGSVAGSTSVSTDKLTEEADFYNTYDNFTVNPIAINAYKYVGSSTTATTVPAATTFTYTFAETDSNTTKAKLAGTSLSSSVTKTINVASGRSLSASGSYSLVDSVGAGFGDLTFSKGGTYTFALTETNLPSKWTEVSTQGGPAERDLAVVVSDDGTIQSVTWTTGDNSKITGTASAWQDFYNTYDADANVGSLSVTKNVQGANAPDASTEYTFTLKSGTNAVANASYTVTDSSGAIATNSGTNSGGQGTTSSTGTFVLKAGQTATFPGLTPGIYTTVETAQTGSSTSWSNTNNYVSTTPGTPTSYSYDSSWASKTYQTTRDINYHKILIIGNNSLTYSNHTMPANTVITDTTTDAYSYVYNTSYMSQYYPSSGSSGNPTINVQSVLGIPSDAQNPTLSHAYFRTTPAGNPFALNVSYHDNVTTLYTESDGKAVLAGYISSSSYPTITLSRGEQAGLAENNSFRSDESFQYCLVQVDYVGQVPKTETYPSGTVTFDADGGSFSSGTTKSYSGGYAQYDSAGLALSKNVIVAATNGIASGTNLNGKTTSVAPTRTGYTFKGWYTGKNGTGTEASSVKLTTSSTTLYAYWTKDPTSTSTTTTSGTDTTSGSLLISKGGSDAITYTNDFSSFNSKLTLSVGKYVKGASAATVPPGGAAFWFGLTEIDNNVEKATAGAITLNATDPYEALVNINEGTAIPTTYGTSPTLSSSWYNTISFPQAGTYTFRVEELSLPTGWAYDTATASSSRTLTVEVGSDGKINTITWSDAVHGSYSGTGTNAASANASFYNTYESSLTVNTKSADFAFKSLTTDSETTVANREFTYTIEPQTAQYTDGTASGTSPLPKDSTGADKTTGSVTLPAGTTTSTAAQHIDFGSITFTKPGIYAYKITENNDGATGWTYDTTPQYVYVTVDYGTDANLSALQLINISTTAPTGTGTYQEIIPVSSTLTARNWNLPGSPVVQRYTATSSISASNPITLTPTIPAGKTILSEVQIAHRVSSNSSTVTATPSTDTVIDSTTFLSVASTNATDGTIVFRGGSMTSLIDNSAYSATFARMYQFVTVSYATLGTTQATFKNKYVQPKGNLQVSKTVAGTGAPSDDTFGFHVTLKDADGNRLTGTYTYVKPDGTTNSITLKTAAEAIYSMEYMLGNGQSFTIQGLPADATYTVQEIDTGDYWSTAWSNGTTSGANQTATGTVGTTTSNVQYTNTYAAPADTSDLTITKKVTGTGAPSTAKFDYTIVFKKADGSFLTGAYNYTKPDGSTGTLDLGANGTATVTGVGADQSFVIQGLPAGTTYTATEADAGADWTPSWTGTESKIIIPLSSNTPDPVSGYTKWSKTLMDYVSTSSPTGVVRTITGIPALSSDYTVSLKHITGPNPDPVNDTDATAQFLGYIGTPTVGGNGIKFTVGSLYSLVGNPVYDKSLGEQYYLYVHSTGQTTASTTTTASAVSGTIGAMDSATFTNAYAPSVKEVTLTKVGTSQTAGNYQKLSGATFTIYKYVGSTVLNSANIDTVAAAGSDTSVWQPITDVDGTVSTTGTPVPYRSDLNGVLMSDTATPTLPKFVPNTYYMIVETAAPAGYTKPLGQWAIQVDSTGAVITTGDSAPLAKRGTDGNLPPALAYTLDIGGTSKNGTFIVDMPIFNLPHAGASMLWLAVVAGLGMLVAAWAVGGRKRRFDEHGRG